MSRRFQDKSVIVTGAGWHNFASSALELSSFV
jgi:hypothetical protein